MFVQIFLIIGIKFLINYKMDTFETRLEKLSSALGMTLKAIGEAIGASHGTLPALKNGKNGISSKYLYEISKKFPQINILYLITGEGDILQAPHTIEEKDASQAPQLHEICERLSSIEQRLEKMETTIGGRLERMEATNDMLREFLEREGVAKKVG